MKLPENMYPNGHPNNITTEETNRREFEEWAMSQDVSMFTFKNRKGKYADPITQAAWEAWQAAREQITEQIDGLRSGIDYASDQLHKVTEQRDKEREIYQKSYSAELARANHYKEQRDRLAGALESIICDSDCDCHTCQVAREALAAVEGKIEKPVNLIHNGVGIADMYSRDEFENAMKQTIQTSVSDEAAKQNTKNLS